VSWSAEQYRVFEEERTRPVRDLLGALPPLEARRAIDLGCGPGNSTAALAARFPAAEVRGLDSSADMIEAARKRVPTVRFDIGDVAAWCAEPPFEARAREAPDAAAVWAAPFDVILANAVLQWVPDHAAVFPALLEKLARGGALAVQMPDNLHEPAQLLMRETAADTRWRAKLAAADAARVPIAAADWYYGLCKARGAKADIWRTTYHHALAGGERAIVEWFKGTDEDERAAFLARYTRALRQAYPPLADGTVLLPFPRLFIVAVR
jgi:trans-aconitate 2-methyltransferase